MTKKKIFINLLQDLLQNNLTNMRTKTWIISNQIKSITEIRKNASRYLKSRNEPIFVVVNNKPTTVIQSVQDYEKNIEEILELKEKIRAQQEADYVEELHKMTQDPENTSYWPYTVDEFIQSLKDDIKESNSQLWS